MKYIPDIVIGIDPGVGGGVAVISDGGILHENYKVPTKKLGKTGNKRQVDASTLSGRLSYAIQEADGDITIVIEKVHAMPGQGVTSMFNFGMHYGVLLGICGALGVEPVLVTPQSWKKTMGLTGTDKKAGVTMARGLTGEPMSSGEADAYLIAEAWRRENGGEY